MTVFLAYALQLASSNAGPVWLVQMLQLCSVILIIGIAIRTRYSASSARDFSLSAESYVHGGVDVASFMSIFYLPAQSALGIFLTRAPGVELVSAIGQTIVFMLALFAMRWIIVYENQHFLRDSAYAILGLGILMICVDTDGFLGAISGGSSDIGARARFSPLDNHPNLIGHTFGVGTVIFAALIAHSPTRSRKFVPLVGLIVCSAIVAATLSRGAGLASLIGVLVVAALGSTREWRQRLMVFVLLLITLGSSSFFNTTSRISTFFELDSEQRGLASGGSGRDQVWAVVVRESLGDPISSIIGNGLRTWPTELLGVSTDSSYLNALWELGIVGLAILVAVLTIRGYQILHLPSGPTKTLLAGLFFFMVCESVVARYLLAIGNPGSIVCLIMFVVRPRDVRRWLEKSASHENVY